MSTIKLKIDMPPPIFEKWGGYDLDKRYLLFGGVDHYASGGMSDLLGSSASLSDVTLQLADFARRKEIEWAQVVDTQLCVVWFLDVDT